MTAEEIIGRVRELELRSRRLSAGPLAGEYHSAFKGRGMHFREVREYQTGDDTRFIDWNVSARLGHPYVKLFDEERALTMFLLVDISPSTRVGTLRRSKREMITEVCALLAFAAVRKQDKVGALLFSDRVECYIPPAKGRRHVLYLVRQLLASPCKGRGTDLALALRFLQRTAPRNAVSFLLSDFQSDGYERTLHAAARRHDLTGIKVYDRMDMHLPRVGLLRVEDAETGGQVCIDTESDLVQYAYSNRFLEAENACRGHFRKAGADLLYLRTDEDPVRVLQSFFRARR